MTAPLHQAPDADEPNLSARLDEAIAKWEERGPTSLTVALLAECVYAARDSLSARAVDPRTHDGNHAPLPPGKWLAPGFCAGCDAERADPDADVIVAALAEAVGSICSCGHLALRHDSGGCGFRALPHACLCRVPLATVLPQALAPTVARLIEDAETRAVARHVRSKHAADCEAFTTPLGKCTCDREAERRRAIEDAVAERLAGVEAALSAVENRHQFHGTQCVCGYTSSRSRSRTEHITAPVRAALSGGGEQ